MTTSFYNIHHVFQSELGDDMGFLAWRDVGLNPYGNSVIVNAAIPRKNKPLIDKFVKVTQTRLRRLREGAEALRAGADRRQRRAQFDNEMVELAAGRSADERQVSRERWRSASTTMRA